MIDRLQIERDLELLWSYRYRPSSVIVSHDLMEQFAKKRPGGGNSHQRRKWYRQWSPTRWMK